MNLLIRSAGLNVVNTVNNLDGLKKLKTRLKNLASFEYPSEDPADLAILVIAEAFSLVE